MIYVVVPNFNISGGIKVGCQWVRLLLDNGFEAAVVTPEPQQCPAWLGFDVPTLGYRDMQNNAAVKVVHIWLDCLKEIGDTVSYAQTYYFAQDCAQPQYVNTWPGRFETEYLPLLRGCTLITVSHSTRRWYLHRYGLRSRVVHNWVDHNRFRCPEVGAGMEEAVMIRHRDHFDDAVFESLRPRVVLAEGTQDQVADTLRRARVFVSCARGRADGYEFSEGLPMPILEAMASGCVPICPDTNGVRDVIIHGVNGWLLENVNGVADNPVAYADALDHAMGNDLVKMAEDTCPATAAAISHHGRLAMFSALGLPTPQI